MKQPTETGQLRPDPTWEPRKPRPANPGRKRLRIEAAIHEIAEEGRPLSVRHIFYSLLTRRLGLNKKRDYPKVGDYIVAMRRAGLLPWEWVVDSTREHGGRRWAATDAPEYEAEVYLDVTEEWDWRPSVWQFVDDPVHVELWTETRGMAASLLPVASRWGVGVTATGGQPSSSLIWQAAQEMAAAQAEGKEVHVVYVGDADEHGFGIERQALNDLHWTHGIDLKWRRAALLASEAAELGALDAEVIPVREMRRRVSRAIRSLAGDAWERRSEARAKWAREMQGFSDLVKRDPEIAHHVEMANDRIRELLP